MQQQQRLLHTLVQLFGAIKLLIGGEACARVSYPEVVLQTAGKSAQIPQRLHDIDVGHGWEGRNRSRSVAMINRQR